MEVLAALTLALLMLRYVVPGYGALQVGFYRGKCGLLDVESIIRDVVTGQFIKDPRIVSALLRLQYHDCFVKGCDASILLDGYFSEKAADPNNSVWGYSIIDQVKAAVERNCPGVVSCADIIILATRDAVFLWWCDVVVRCATGRRDGLVSLARNVDLPSSSTTMLQSIAAFAQKGLNLTDMVLLLGGHGVGVTHCSLIWDRLYNYRSTRRPDPTMDPLLAASLRLRCPWNAGTNNTIDLDQRPVTSYAIDTSYYRQIIMNRGILRIDQELALSPLTRNMVTSLADGFSFPSQFGVAMVKLGAVEVLTGREGQIRRNCRALN